MISSSVLLAKLALGALLLIAIALRAWARPPRRSPAPADLRRLVAGSLLLYGGGLCALLDDRGTVAMAAFASGVSAASLAAWLSRGPDADDPPRDEDGPAPEPSGWDWERFDRDRVAWQRRPREPSAR
jgi:hypothetical protein